MLKSAVELEFGYNKNILPDTIQQEKILNIPISITSMTAHSIPSGTSFNRQVWLELTVSNNDFVIFQSGNVNNSEQLNFNDPNLLLFSSYLIDEEGNFTNNITEIYNIENNSLLAYSSRVSNIEVLIPNDLSGNLNIVARILFRPFNPEFIMNHHPEFIENLPIYEIDSITKTVEIN